MELLAFGSGRTTAGVIAKVDAILLEMPSTAEPANVRTRWMGFRWQHVQPT